MPSSAQFPVRLVLEEKDRGRKCRVAWEDSWLEAKDIAPSVDRLDNLAILGITQDSDQKKIKKAMFVIENKGEKSKENQQQVWSYEKVRSKAPELLLDFYEKQLENTK